MLSSLGATHSLPRFDGPRSRGHRNVPLWRLHLRALAQRLRTGRQLSGVETFVQFVGFPRSGHSLVGSILDAHAEAVIAHELDAMGLVEAGFPGRAIEALIVENARAFSRNGRHWNGYRYVVPGQAHGASGRVRVIGDKKGDWVARRVGEDPELIDRARKRLRARTKWILVVRDPFDNIATMSLRQGRVYDRLRIEHPGEQAFREALHQHQRSGEIAAEALDDMIDDYRVLCEGVERLRARVPAGDWLEIHYDAFAAAPEAGIRSLLGFLGLGAEDGFVGAAASIVRPGGHSSRDAVTWAPAQARRVEAMMAEFPFLSRYREAHAGGLVTGQRAPI